MSFTSCGNDDITVTGITLDGRLAELPEGSAYKLVATIIPDNATDKTLTWNSNNPAVHTVIPVAA